MRTERAIATAVETDDTAASADTLPPPKNTCDSSRPVPPGVAILTLSTVDAYSPSSFSMRGFLSDGGGTRVPFSSRRFTPPSVDTSSFSSSKMERRTRASTSLRTLPPSPSSFLAGEATREGGRRCAALRPGAKAAAGEARSRRRSRRSGSRTASERPQRPGLGLGGGAPRQRMGGWIGQGAGNWIYTI